MGFISYHEEKWQLVGDRVRTVIMSEFSKGNVLSPGSRIGATEDPKVSFYLLVNTFSFSIGLRVKAVERRVHSREVYLVLW